MITRRAGVVSRLAPCIGVALRVPVLRRIREIGFTLVNGHRAISRLSAEADVCPVKGITSRSLEGRLVRVAPTVAGGPRVYK
ncbi:MAG TPA: hypothetical protein VH559_15875 [Gemmatimonadaceae bacterium]